MTILRISQYAATENKYLVELRLEDVIPIQPPVRVEFEFEISEEDYSHLRWYLEDYLQYPMDPAPEIASRIENRMQEIGIQLYERVFGTRDAIKLWGRLQTVGLSNVRVEIVTGVLDSATIPWELIRDPDTNTPIAIEAKSFVRATNSPARLPTIPNETPAKVRILLVISRPGGTADVPFRSVAGKLLKGLTEEAREQFELDVLRPPTFEQLGKTLRRAKLDGRPYHIVHFDGHGVYLTSKDTSKAGIVLGTQTHLLLGGAEIGPNGYVLFENPRQEQNLELVDGTSFGRILSENDVSILVLNACRSAHTDIQRGPEDEANSHDTIRAYGSFAQTVMDAGVAGVVAMRYNVYVVTAAQFMAELYSALAQGAALGEAVTHGRKNLSENAYRTIAFDPIQLQDWCIPIVYEAAPLRLFQKVVGQKLMIDNITKGWARRRNTELPEGPDSGFFGRDETLLSLDRILDYDSIVLLCAYAGQGKTATAVEFARWYSMTGGISGPVLFTKFDQYRSLAQVLDSLAEVFEPLLKQSNILWISLDETQREELALQILQQVPLFWIWDNVETIGGFPNSDDSPWSIEEKEQFARFLRRSRATKAKFLLTSRRDERDWLADLPVVTKLPSMPMQECIQLAGAMVQKQNQKMERVINWLPLLKFAQGNPLTITVLVRQALFSGISTKEEVTEFLRQLDTGYRNFGNETELGRSHSLAASLAYGFSNAFKQDERDILSALYLFKEFVSPASLKTMLNPVGEEWHGGRYKSLDLTNAGALLERASHIGLVSKFEETHFQIHPALNWFLKDDFLKYHVPIGKEDHTVTDAYRAFVMTMATFGEFAAREFAHGNRIINLLKIEEANLLYARGLALQHNLDEDLISIMTGLNRLYLSTGRIAEWSRLLDEILPRYMNLKTFESLPGREEEWPIVLEYRIDLARRSRDWDLAIDLLEKMVVRLRHRHDHLEGLSDENVDTKWIVRHNLGATLVNLGEVQSEKGLSESARTFEDAYAILRMIKNDAGAAHCALNLGNVYKNNLDLLDLDKAEKWYQVSLSLRPAKDTRGRGMSIGALGLLYVARFYRARAQESPIEEQAQHLEGAIRFFEEAMELTPSNDPENLAMICNSLGNIYGLELGKIDKALPYWQEAIKHKLSTNNRYHVGLTRMSIARGLFAKRRGEEALSFARAALTDFQSFGAAASREVEEVSQFISNLTELLAKLKGLGDHDE